MKRFLMLLIPFFLLGCPDASSSGNGDTNDYVSPSINMVVEANTTYYHTIASFDTNSYIFIPETSGSYTFTLTNTLSDLSIWIEDGDGTDILDVDDFGEAVNESGSATLTAGTSYYIDIDEWDSVESHYSFRITSN